MKILTSSDLEYIDQHHQISSLFDPSECDNRFLACIDYIKQTNKLLTNIIKNDDDIIYNGESCLGDYLLRNIAQIFQFSVYYNQKNHVKPMLSPTNSNIVQKLVLDMVHDTELISKWKQRYEDDALLALAYIYFFGNIQIAMTTLEFHPFWVQLWESVVLNFREDIKHLMTLDFSKKVKGFLPIGLLKGRDYQAVKEATSEFIYHGFFKWTVMRDDLTQPCPYTDLLDRYLDDYIKYLSNPDYVNNVIFRSSFYAININDYFVAYFKGVQNAPWLENLFKFIRMQFIESTYTPVISYPLKKTIFTTAYQNFIREHPHYGANLFIKNLCQDNIDIEKLIDVLNQFELLKNSTINCGDYFRAKLKEAIDSNMFKLNNLEYSIFIQNVEKLPLTYQKISYNKLQS